MMIPKHYEDLQVLHENTMPPRAYYIPASKRISDPAEHREESDRMELLNGSWKFRYCPGILELKDNFYQDGYDAASFDDIAVPGTWQTSGYDRHQYTNIRYPFPFDPPYVPLENPCGAYLRYFEYHTDPAAPKAFLNFEGVDSCYYVWLNGSYIGYSQVSHATAEFDITGQLRDGSNTLAVLVLKWCDGSYLEDQDKFRMSGIFRDVYILKRPVNAIRDYCITTDIMQDRAQLMQQSDLLCGGFVWEWCDHAVYHGTAENGKPMYFYGGDHGEVIHDGNFCMDGLVYPDRTPHTGLLEYKNVHRPVRLISYDRHSGELILHNYLDFADLSDYVSISYELSQDDTVIEHGTLETVSVKPHTDGRLSLPLLLPDAGRVYLKLTYRLAKAQPLLEPCYELGFDELLLSKPDQIHLHAAELLKKHENGFDTCVSETPSELTLKGKDFTYTLNKQTGLFSSMICGLQDILCRPMEINIWRAPTDNDMYIREEWQKAHYHQAYTRAYSTQTLQNKYGIFVLSHVSLRFFAVPVTLHNVFHKANTCYV